MKERQTSTNRKSVKKANKLGRLLLILFVFAGIFGGLFFRIGYIKTVHGEESVSYTHLDVYKRQRYYHSALVALSARIF